MISKRNALSIVCGSLAISSQMLAPAISGPPKQVKPQSAAVRQVSDRPTLTEDQARLLVKEIPSVNIGETLARWSFSEIELAKLRQWSALLAEQPDRTDFLPQWTELVSKFRARNASLQSADVGSFDPDADVSRLRRSPQRSRLLSKEVAVLQGNAGADQ